jgi:hypothetical protein
MSQGQQNLVLGPEIPTSPSSKLDGKGGRDSPVKRTPPSSPQNRRKLNIKTEEVSIHCVECDAISTFRYNTNLEETLEKNHTLNELCELWRSSKPKCVNECGRESEVDCKTCGAMCTTCSDSIHSNPMFSKHVRTVIDPSVMKNCPQHSTQVLDKYDFDCERVICNECLASSEHHDHDVISVDEYKVHCSKQLMQALHDFDEKVNLFSKTDDALCRMIDSVKEHHARRDREISNSWDMIVETALARKSRMLHESKNIMDDKG